MRYTTTALLFTLCAWVLPAQAFELDAKKVTDKVYALVGDIDQRTKENLGLNNTLGFVFNDRMLGLLPETSKVKSWLATFNKLAELKPEHVVPGHGYPSDMATAQKAVGDYLGWLVEEVGKAVTDMEDIGDAVKRIAADTRFDFLKFHKEWNSRNIHQTYIQLEAE